MASKALESQQDIPCGSLRMVRKMVKSQQSLPFEAAERLTKAMTLAGIDVDMGLPSHSFYRTEPDAPRQLDDLCKKQIHMYSVDEEHPHSLFKGTARGGLSHVRTVPPLPPSQMLFP